MVSTCCFHCVLWCRCIPACQLETFHSCTFHSFVFEYWSGNTSGQFLLPSENFYWKDIMTQSLTNTSSIDTWLLFTTNSSFLLLSYFNCSFLCLLYLFDLLIKVCKISHYSTCHVGSLSWAVKQDDLYVMLGSRKLLLHLNVCTNYWSWKVISDKLLH